MNTVRQNCTHSMPPYKLTPQTGSIILVRSDLFAYILLTPITQTNTALIIRLGWGSVCVGTSKRTLDITLHHR